MMVRRSPQETHDRSPKDSQQKQLSIVGQAITAKDSRQKPQRFTAKANASWSAIILMAIVKHDHNLFGYQVVFISVVNVPQKKSIDTVNLSNCFQALLLLHHFIMRVFDTAKLL